jgi:hypothetical protein
MKKDLTPALNDDESFGLLRNALLVAGAELGPDGDHWPLIKGTIHQLAKDCEDLKTARATEAEMKKHLYAQLREAEARIDAIPPEDRAEVEAQLKELRQIYDATFAPAELDELALEEIDAPPHLKSAAAILETWEEENA